MANVYLTGFMGTGKSSVGRALARRLGRPFIDVDARIEAKAGDTVARLFARRGEGEFRRLERDVVAAAAREEDAVVALGGGALLDVVNQRAVLGSGVLVCLTCSQPELWRRLRPELPKRPLLRGGKAALLSLLRARRPLQALAQLRVSTTHRTPAAAAGLIARRLEGWS